MSPIPFRWSGEEMIPLRGFAMRADEQYTVGEVYVLERVESRSGVSHRHYFATINDMWASLPEHMSARFQTPDVLRKHALMMVGYRDEESFVASSKAEAIRIAAFMRPRDEYQIISVNGPVVVRWTAKSQNLRAMGAKEFQDSKTKVLDWISGLIGVNREGAAA